MAERKTTSSKKKRGSSKKKVKRKKKKALSKLANQDNPDDFRDVEAEIVEPGQPLKTESKSTKSLSISDPVAAYLAEVRRYPVLTKEEELRWAKIYRETKDSKAAEVLVTSNLRFVVKVAAEYSKFGARLIDLIQEGNLGLMHAVKEFNPYKDVRLITYAVWWIRGYIQEYLMRQYSMVRIGTTQNQRKLFYQLQKEQENLEKLGLEAGIKQLSGRLGIPEDEVEMMQQRMGSRDVSLDAPVGDDDRHHLIDYQIDEADTDLEESLEHLEELKLLKENISSLEPELNEREKELLHERLLADEPLTLQEIGDRHGISREAVRQMEARLLNKIKDQMKDSIQGEG